MFSNIPRERLILYIWLLGLLPIVFALFQFKMKQNELNELANLLQQVKFEAAAHEKKQAVNITVRNNFRDADHFYIDKNLETLDFLEPEEESLQKVLDNKNFPDDENIKKRLEFLSGPSNNLVFTEGVVQSNPLFQETTETLVHPVEVNVQDIKKILSKIEGVTIGSMTPNPNRPQLIILDFKIEKKMMTENNEVFLLNLKLLKREFL